MEDTVTGNLFQNYFSMAEVRRMKARHPYEAQNDGELTINAVRISLSAAPPDLARDAVQG